MRSLSFGSVPDAVYVLFASILQRGSALVLTLSAVRSLAPAEFGAFGYGYATAVTLSAFFGDAVSTAALREPETKNGFASPNGDILSAYLGLAILGASAISGMVGVAALVAFQDSSASGIVAMMVLSFSLALNTSSFAVLCRRGFRRQAAVCSIGGSVAILVASVWPGGLPDASAYLWVSALGLLATLACHLAHLFRHAGAGLRVARASIVDLRGQRMSFLAKTGAALALGGPVHWLCLTILAHSSDGLVQVAIYAAFFQWYLVLTFIPASVVYLTVPWLAEGHSTEGRAGLSRRLNSLLGFSAVAGVIIIAVAAFAAPTVARIYGPEYGEHWPSLVAAIACAAVAVLVAFGMQAYLASGRAGENLFATSIYSVLYLAFTTILVGFGGLGALGLFSALLVASLVQGAVQHYLILKPVS